METFSCASKGKGLNYSKYTSFTGLERLLLLFKAGCKYEKSRIENRKYLRRRIDWLFYAVVAVSFPYGQILKDIHYSEVYHKAQWSNGLKVLKSIWQFFTYFLFLAF